MNYQQTVDYLFHKLPMFSRIGSAAIKNSLDNIEALCNALGNPQNNFKSIHIAGTNGKGSVSHMLASVLQHGGYKTGLYTSPHLYDFRERIKINGEMVSEDFVIRFVQNIQPLLSTIHASFFEITVAMAFAFFAEQSVDIAVIEVGLGGRLDSTNIIHPLLSIINNISFDHTNLLGHTLTEIAYEKGGIIKEKVPIVIGEKNKETATVFQSIADQKIAPLYFAEDHYSVSNFHLGVKEIELEVFNKKQNKLQKFATDLPGIYQKKNILTVLLAIEFLQDLNFNISEDAIKNGLAMVKKTTGLLGRWEVIKTKPSVVLEVAHNEAGIEQMLQHLSVLQYNNLHLVLGAVKDKDIQKILSLLPSNATYYFTQAHIPRALPAEALAAEAILFNLNGTTFKDVNEALQAALTKAIAEDIIIVCGSIFLVAEVNKNQFQ